MEPEVVDKWDGNAKTLRRAQRILAQGAAQAEREGTHGTVGVEITYQDGIAQTITRRLVDRHQ